MDVKIYLTNLAQYNAGRLVGKWLELPVSEEELARELQAVLGRNEEYFITDYSADFRIEDKVIYLINCVGYNRQDALEKIEDVIYYQGMTLEEVAEEMVEDGMLGTLSDTVKGYLDFEKIARGLSFDGYHETTKGTFWCS